jgi:tRNA 2-thiouridine synthesizing protein A
VTGDESTRNRAAAGEAAPGGAASGETAGGESAVGPVVLDCRGQRCPLPIIALARKLPDVPIGEIVRVLADDPAAANDVPAWCRMKGQQYLGEATKGEFDVKRIS